MKKLSSISKALMMGVLLTFSLSSCSDDNDGGDDFSAKDSELSALTGRYVNDVIYVTYGELASQTERLYEQLDAAKAKFRANTLTQNDIDNICTTFLAARAAWEKSEAFLFGPATTFGIDPHIDTWPLNVTQLAIDLSNSEKVNTLDGEDGIEYARTGLGESLLGFHGIEFIIFRDGRNRTLAELRSNETDNAFAGRTVTGEQELIFATAVAGDLRDKCFQLEVSWMGDKAPASHVDRVEECEFNTTVNGNGLSFGEDMLNAGKAGSTYTTWRNVTTTILVAGCANIAQEVSDQKMGQAYRGDDVNYIESPYSKKSFLDFYDNIISIKNSLYGNIDGTTWHRESIMAYLTQHNPDIAAELNARLNGALTALTACRNSGTAFVDAPNAAYVKTAMDAIGDLDEKLNEAAQWIARN